MPVNILYLENHAVFAQQVTRLFLSAHRVTIVSSLAVARSAIASNTSIWFSPTTISMMVRGGVCSRMSRQISWLPIIAVSSHEAGNAALGTAGASAVCSKSSTPYSK
jgi:hypothetical protein